MASTVLLSRRLQQFNTVPYPFLYGPKGTGKTQALELLNALCYKPLLSPDMSTAAIFQIIEAVHPTLLLDETDNIARKVQNENTHNMVQILNAGYRRGQRVVRGSRDGTIPQLYDVFGLKILAGTELLPDTLADRTIRLDCERNVKDIPLEIPLTQLEELQGQLEMYQSIYEVGRAAEGNPQPVTPDIDVEQLKDEIGDNRTTQLFLPLYTVCPTEDGQHNLFDLAREQVEEKHSEESAGDLSEVLEAVYTTWETLKTENLPLDSIKENCSFETKPEKTDSIQWLAYRLKKLQLRTRRIGHVRYVLVSERKLVRMARRYCPQVLRTLESR